ncbi:uncharacterized protein LOC127264447 isoform X2 [Andrographis paniculata]|uniref:uncharacterized protein LOC127264447 isoform X2 n=1 Tax=Andrographis paniculata TaxID=175694 RepID=UPI0021E94A50|nr:uncharacterized protein LOC127264447 isoform X2 [Andrographis paniculata]
MKDNKLLDLPTLLDICAIYGHENEDLTHLLVTTAMKAQPYINDDFPVLIYHFLSIVQTMYQRCSSSLEVLLSSGSHQDQGFSNVHHDYLGVMDFINDSVVSLDSFVNAYKQAAAYFSSPAEMGYGNEDVLTTLARLHDSLLPSLQRGFRVIFGVEDRNKETSNDALSNIVISLKMFSTRMAQLGWRLLYLCYLSDEAFEGCDPIPVSTNMFPANVEDPTVRADILIQTIRDLSGDQPHVPGGTFIQNIEKNHKILSRIELLRKAGWLSMDDEQWQFLSKILDNPPADDTKMKTAARPAAGGSSMQTDEDAAIIESKISQIKELFPDYGRGFLLACLEAYNHDPEDVIQRILEGTLHTELTSLDTSSESIPSSKPPSVAANDKGKGKLVEATVSSSSSSSWVGRFVRKNNNELSDHATLNAKREKELAKTAALISQFEYEDEYDDSFDDLGLSVGDSGVDEPERQDDRRGAEANDNGGSTSGAADGSKWNSRKKPQFYVKDGKNYSYKVDGSVAVANVNEARLVNQAQKELIHGLGRGGNIPLGAIRRLAESEEEQKENDGQGGDEVGGRGGRGSFRGRGRRGGAPSRPPQEKDEQENGGGRGGQGNHGGGGRRGRGGRHNNNNHRKDRAMGKHFSGMPGHYGGT